MKRKQIIDKLNELELAKLKEQEQRKMSKAEFCLTLDICTLWDSIYKFLEHVTPEDFEKNLDALHKTHEVINLGEKILNDMKNGDMRSYNELLALWREEGECENA